MERKPALIPLQEVKSSNLAAVGYDPARETFAVQFKSGPAQYQYAGVPKKVVEQVMAAPSLGSAVSSLIIKGGYAHQKIDPES